MDDNKIATNITTGRSVFLEAAKALARLEIPVEHIAASAASVAASLLGTVVQKADIDNVIEEMTTPMKSDAHKSRDSLDASIAESNNPDNPLNWLSFADEHQSLGVVLVRASNFLAAIRLSHALGINPGGAVTASALPRDIEPALTDADINRLLSPEEAMALKQRVEEFAGRTLN